MDDDLKDLQIENLTIDIFRVEGMPINNGAHCVRITDNVLKIQVTSTRNTSGTVNRRICIEGLKAMSKGLR